MQHYRMPETTCPLTNALLSKFWRFENVAVRGFKLNLAAVVNALGSSLQSSAAKISEHIRTVKIPVVLTSGPQDLKLKSKDGAERTVRLPTRGLGCDGGVPSMVARLARKRQMSALRWGVLGGLVVVCLALVIAWRRSVATDAALAERASRPDALRDAELLYMERLFRTSKPVGLVARLDRAYRMPSGLLVLVEFKTRWINRPCLSDVIQLSAQRLAVMGQTGQAVAPYGYVMVKTPSNRALPIAHRVSLMAEAQLLALVRRREDVLAGHVLPRRSSSRKTCLGCAFRAKCDAAIH